MWYDVYYTVRGDHYGGERSKLVQAPTREEARWQVGALDSGRTVTRVEPRESMRGRVA